MVIVVDSRNFFRTDVEQAEVLENLSLDSFFNPDEATSLKSMVDLKEKYGTLFKEVFLDSGGIFASLLDCSQVLCLCKVPSSYSGRKIELEKGHTYVIQFS